MVKVPSISNSTSLFVILIYGAKKQRYLLRCYVDLPVHFLSPIFRCDRKVWVKKRKHSATAQDAVPEARGVVHRGS